MRTVILILILTAILVIELQYSISLGIFLLTFFGGGFFLGVLTALLPDDGCFEYPTDEQGRTTGNDFWGT